MTHGAMIARQHCVPAIPRVEHATAVIRDGQHGIHGADGHVEIPLQRVLRATRDSAAAIGQPDAAW
jgi:hypothetical protein